MDNSSKEQLNRIFHYFPDFSDLQREQITALFDLYVHWNQQINVISRKDMENFYMKHVLHSLAIAKFWQLPAESEVLDLGTGGGFPGIPLAIMFPNVKFHLVDSIGKKIKVVQAISSSLNLTNVTSEQARVEELKETYHFVVSRAVKPLPQLATWLKGKTRDLKGKKASLLALKGGDLTEEVKPLKKHVEILELSEIFSEDFFETKKLVCLTLHQ